MKIGVATLLVALLSWAIGDIRGVGDSYILADIQTPCENWYCKPHLLVWYKDANGVEVDGPIAGCTVTPVTSANSDGACVCGGPVGIKQCESSDPTCTAGGQYLIDLDAGYTFKDYVTGADLGNNEVIDLVSGLFCGDVKGAFYYIRDVNGTVVGMVLLNVICPACSGGTVYCH